MTNTETTQPPGIDKHRPGSHLTVPQFHRLNWACQPIRRGFDCSPYEWAEHDGDLRNPMGVPR